MTDSVRRSRRRCAGPLALALALASALFVVLPFTELRAGFTADEGSYAIQAEALDVHDDWSIGWPFRAYDLEGQHFPYHAGTVTSDDEFAYVSHPAWPAALAVVRGVVGEGVGLRLLSIVSVVTAAITGYLLAARVGGRSTARWAFAVVAAGPVLASGFMIWAHAPSAATAGVALVSAVSLQQRVTLGPAVLLAGSLGVGVLLRSEGLLFAGALLLVFGAASLRAKASERVRRLIVVGAAGVTAAAVLLVEREWRASIVGESGAAVETGRAGGGLAGRVDGARIVLFDGSLFDDRAGAVSLVGILFVGAAAFLAMRPQRRIRPWHMLALAAAIGLARLAMEPTDPILGLFAAAPILVLGAVAFDRGSATTGGSDSDRMADGAAQSLIAGTAFVFTAAVVATQYDDGGGVQWGGRYLAPAWVALAVLAACGIERVRRVDHRAAVASIAVLAVGAVSAIVIPDQVRRENRSLVEALDAAGPDVVIVGNDQAGRLDWATWPERQWIAVDDDLDGVVDVLRAAAVTAASTVVVPVVDLEGADVAVQQPASRGDVVTVQISPRSNVRSQVVAPG